MNSLKENAGLEKNKETNFESSRLWKQQIGKRLKQWKVCKKWNAEKKTKKYGGI